MAFLETRPGKALSIRPLYSLHKSFSADTETPISLFLKLGGEHLLESVEKGEYTGRYSVITKGALSRITLNGATLTITEIDNGKEEVLLFDKQKDPFLGIKEYMKRLGVSESPPQPFFTGGLLGFLGFEAVQYFEKVPVHQDHMSDIPDAMMIVPENVIVYDSVTQTIHMTAWSRFNNKQRARNNMKALYHTLKAASQNDPELPSSSSHQDSAEPLVTRKQFLERVRACLKHIHAGDVIQVVLSQPFRMKTSLSPLSLYRALRKTNPSPYLFLNQFPHFSIIGSSPETMVQIKGDELILRPIAGTRPRGKSIKEDKILAQELLNDPKERAEHLMLLDLGRNDLGRVSKPGSVQVVEQMHIENYSHVMHIVSTIKGVLEAPWDAFDVIRAVFPAGTLSGAPKIRAMEIIYNLEKRKRGIYGGMVFHLDFNGNMDSCITIRTMVASNGTVTFQSGAGIVADSIPENEYQETLYKSQALTDAVCLASQTITEERL